MDQQSQAKLARTHSPLLWSSSTVESSTFTISSVNDLTFHREMQDVEERKPHTKPRSASVRSGSRYDSAHLAPLLAIFLLSVYTLFCFLYRGERPTSKNLLLLLIFMAISLFFASPIKASIRKNFSIYVNLCDDYVRRAGISCFGSKSPSKPVQWFIGEPGIGKVEKKQSMKKIIREGVEFYSNGDFYEGEFHKGRCSGSGVYHYFVSGIYEGDWIDGRYDGYGIENWARGSRYKGQYRQGLRHGYGVYKFYTGDTYAGEWCNGQSNGIGEQICADGISYIGEFKGGVKHGLGCYHFRNGDRYTGEYFGDKMHGFGVYQFANGHLYEGSWHEGGKQGYGMYTFRNGETKCGEWSGGNIKTPLPSSADAVLRAIQLYTSLQAARKGAENAIHLPRLDEQVNNAVTAANKAATAARVAAVKAVQNRIDGKFCEINF
ncbi:junctophilin-3-like [Dorcoceras hygrometricum]|uniref:Junctophilin-3-like n=1 Tax=Dorcoceras hygrometricum TaxID=472368 RepID=A0A2Z7A6X6_9LAMI|nr:junctophilin-3-like [Dorcoceras hygrometricum]